MALTQQEIAQRTGRPVAKLPPTMAELFSQFGPKFKELGGPLTGAQDMNARLSLQGILSMIDDAIAKKKVNEEVAARAAEAKNPAKMLALAAEADAKNKADAAAKAKAIVEANAKLQTEQAARDLAAAQAKEEQLKADAVQSELAQKATSEALAALTQ
jgi:hypothetical protein